MNRLCIAIFSESPDLTRVSLVLLHEKESINLFFYFGEMLQGRDIYIYTESLPKYSEIYEPQYHLISKLKVSKLVAHFLPKQHLYTDLMLVFASFINHSLWRRHENFQRRLSKQHCRGKSCP